MRPPADATPTTPTRQRKALTDRHLRALRPGPTAIEVWDGQQRGLIVRVLPSGQLEFAVRYRIRGKRRRLKLGAYPSVTLSEARKRARKAQSAIDNGADPARDRQVAKIAPTDTVEALAQDYLRRHAQKFKRSADEDERILNRDVLPFWRGHSVKGLTRRDVRQLIDRVSDRGAPIMANRVLAVVRKMLNFAVAQDWIEGNPAALIAKPGAESERERVLTDEEIRRLWRLLSHHPETAEKAAPGRRRAAGTDDDPICPISTAHAAILKLRLLTAQRGGEVARMRWADLDLEAKWWTIPSAHTKNKKAHRVPLTDRAVEIIKALRRDGDEEEREAVFSSAESARDRAKKAPSIVGRVLKLTDFRAHDLRRTAATRMGEAGVPRAHISYLLNHVDGAPRATKIYDRAQHDAEKLTAVASWDWILTAILEGKDAGKVLPFAQTGA